MKQKGYVTEITDGMARVKVSRDSACGGNCVSCKGCPSNSVIVDCRIDGNINVGDCVELTMPNGSFFKGVYFGYIQMTLLMLLGAIVGYRIFGFDGASLIGAAVGLAIGIFLAKFVFSAKRNKTDITARPYNR